MTARKNRVKMWRLFTVALGIIGLYLASVVVAPQLLAFPYQAQVGTTRVYAEAPIDPRAVHRVLARADARLATSPLYHGPVGTRVFLTDGGWRWRILAMSIGDSLGFTRPASDLVSDAVILNSSDIARDRVPTAYGGRSLSGVIAHERTHIMVRRHVGHIRGLMLPAWISEGYADHVGGESTLSAAQAAALVARGRHDRPLFYYQARQRVEAVLAANGGDVDALLASQ